MDRLHRATALCGVIVTAACTEPNLDTGLRGGELLLADHAETAGVLDAGARNRGLGAADFDSDGNLDLFLANTGDPARLFLGNGDGTFRGFDAPDSEWEVAVATADYDDDGDVDVFVACGGWVSTCPNRLYRNDGPDGTRGVTFTDVTESSGIGLVEGASFGGSWADYDRDGDLDLFVPNKVRNGDDDPFFSMWDEGPRPTLSREAPTRDLLYRNEGDGRFTEVGAAAGIDHPGHHHEGVWFDADGDGWIDLYVPAFDEPNLLWHNRGDGTFEDIAEAAGVQAPFIAFGAVANDLDNDGHMDLVVSAHHSHAPDFEAGVEEENGVYLNDGTGHFVQVARQSGLNQDVLHRGFMGVMGLRMGDLDLDGFTDVFFGNGGPFPGAEEVNGLYRTVPDEETGVAFIDRSDLVDVAPVGGVTTYPNRSHGSVFADFDQDGDMDLFIGNGGMTPDQREPNRLFLNESTTVHGWVDVSLDAVTSATDGVGAILRLSDGPADDATWSRTLLVTAGTGFNSSYCGPQRLGAGLHPPPYHLTITWPDGTVDEVEGLGVGEHVWVEESE